jgi:zeaxanthin glucosyltransferase
MKVGFISLPVPGHFNPMSAVARQLQSRNHDVVMLSLSLSEPLVRAANLPFIPFGEKDFPDQVNAEILGTMGQLKGDEGLQFSVDVVAKFTKAQWRELPKLLPANDIDVLVLDNYAFYGEVVPMYLGMPYAILANALHFDYSGYTPLCVYGWGARENARRATKKPSRRLGIYGDADSQQR